MAHTTLSAFCQVYTFGPDINEECIRKETLFKDSLYVDFVLPHREEFLNMQDSVAVDFNVNIRGHVDTVWLAKPITRPFPFEGLSKYIRSYDFKGPLLEYYTTEPKRYACTVRLLFTLDRQRRILYVSIDYRNVREVREGKN